MINYKIFTGFLPCQGEFTELHEGQEGELELAGGGGSVQGRGGLEELTLSCAER